MTKLIVMPEDAPEYCPAQFYWELDREGQKLSYENMAVLFACHPNTISNWVSGRGNSSAIDRRLAYEIRERWIRQGKLLVPNRRK